MYSAIISSVMAPTVTQKYPRDQRCCPQYRFFNAGYSSCNRLDVRPFRYCTIFDGARLGGQESNRCTWSTSMCPFTIVIPRLCVPCTNRFFSRLAISFVIILYRYFVIHTMWYLMSYLAWLLLWYRSICPSPLLSAYQKTCWKPTDWKSVDLNRAFRN